MAAEIRHGPTGAWGWDQAASVQSLSIDPGLQHPAQTTPQGSGKIISADALAFWRPAEHQAVTAP
jgi:hypothetical protein